MKNRTLSVFIGFALISNTSIALAQDSHSNKGFNHNHIIQGGEGGISNLATRDLTDLLDTTTTNTYDLQALELIAQLESLLTTLSTMQIQHAATVSTLQQTLTQLVTDEQERDVFWNTKLAGLCNTY